MKKEKHLVNNEEWEECKKFFNYRCAYCGELYEEYVKNKKQDFHKEHNINNGSNRLDNCVPACGSCNSSKNNRDFEKWYKSKEFFDISRYWKIKRWMNVEYKKYIYAINIKDIVVYNTDKGHLFHIKNDNITLTSFLKKKLKENGRKEKWVANKLNLNYSVYKAKMNNNSISVKEFLVINDILKLDLIELSNMFSN
jgi:hypothetical protein